MSVHKESHFRASCKLHFNERLQSQTFFFAVQMIAYSLLWFQRSCNWVKFTLAQAKSQVKSHKSFVVCDRACTTNGDSESISLYRVEDVVKFQAENWMLNCILSTLKSKTRDLQQHGTVVCSLFHSLNTSANFISWCLHPEKLSCSSSCQICRDAMDRY